jgi:hypothetical protein
VEMSTQAEAEKAIRRIPSRSLARTALAQLSTSSRIAASSVVLLLLADALKRLFILALLVRRHYPSGSHALLGFS